MTSIQKSDWEAKIKKEWDSLEFEKDILPLLQVCHQIAIADVDMEMPYTDVVLKNLGIITNKPDMSVSFNQWKSFRAYQYNYKQKEVNIDRLYKK